MPMGQATTKTMDITYFWLQAPRDLVDCLTQVGSIGYSGQITQSLLPNNGGLRWGIAITGPVLPAGMTTLQANIDDVLLWDGITLRKLSRVDFQAQYTVKT